ncbi:MAG TPA: LysR substrate-binding domain-containing protein [Rhodanobacter sp.]
MLGGQPTLALPSMRAKILAQCDGLGVGWLPRHRVGALLKHGQLVEKRMTDPREPNTLYVAWRSDHEGRALDWWLQQLRQPRLARRLIQGLEVSV